MERLCIYPKDVQVVTGKSERYGRNLLRAIKKKFSKESHQLVTIEEFCNYTGISINSVRQVLLN
ncbi:MAG: hypothetical protein JST94_05505 [Bacteroidetes bacterium]|nr:hypothetical protein [Bacteroidota bacterium]MBS1670897.1 hypothetical protein [Bacteroidota bacterium]